MIWANLLHIYQPPHWDKKIIKRVANESYRPILRFLKNHRQIKITLNINGALTEQLPKVGLKDIIRDLIFLARRGQIEFTGSAKYHVILPLFDANEITRQIELNSKTNQKYFGQLYQPRGFFPPEMCYHPKLIKILPRLNYRWLVLDEIAFRGRLGLVQFDQGYQIQNTSLAVIFRNRILSDPFFTASIKTAADFFRIVSRDERSQKYLITAFDGENLGHHRPGLDRLWGKILLAPKIETTLSYSELLTNYEQFKSVQPLPSSWSSRTKEIKNQSAFNLWHNEQNPIHRLQWRLVNLVIRTLNDQRVKAETKNYKVARQLLDQRINSDPFWWASANPWWSVKIISRGARDLVEIIEPLKTVPLVIKGRAKRLADEIIRLAQVWQSSGRAEKIKKAYLAGEASERYFGGRLVK